MKKVMMIVASLFLTAAAYADTVHITVQSNFVQPNLKTEASTIGVAFKPSQPIKFVVAGKTCNWVSSSSPYGSGGGHGCNYGITVDPSGNLTNATSNGQGCTASGSAMISACN